MAYLTENDSYKLWQMLSVRSWESLYNLLYEDYYEGHKVGLDNQMVYKIMQVAEGFENNNTEFPETYEQFYQTLIQQIGS